MPIDDRQLRVRDQSREPSANHETGADGDGRPWFMLRLGLQLPCTAEDVRQAYKLRAKAAHPDGGGDSARFNELREAYEQGLEHAEFHASRRKWLAQQVDRYLCLQRIIEVAEKHSGRVELQSLAWLRASVGEDFAQVTDRLVGIQLCGPNVGDDAIERLYEERSALQHLIELNLSGASITDKSLDRLRALAHLRRLNLSGTGVTYRGLACLHSLRSLEWLNITGTAVNWWGRMRLGRSLPGVELVTRDRAR